MPTLYSTNEDDKICKLRKLLHILLDILCDVMCCRMEKKINSNYRLVWNENKWAENIYEKKKICWKISNRSSRTLSNVKKLFSFQWWFGINFILRLDSIYPSPLWQEWRKNSQQHSLNAINLNSFSKHALKSIACAEKFQHHYSNSMENLHRLRHANTERTKKNCIFSSIFFSLQFNYIQAVVVR